MTLPSGETVSHHAKDTGSADRAGETTYPGSKRACEVSTSQRSQLALRTAPQAREPHKARSGTCDRDNLRKKRGIRWKGQTLPKWMTTLVSIGRALATADNQAVRHPPLMAPPNPDFGALLVWMLLVGLVILTFQQCTQCWTSTRTPLSTDKSPMGRALCANGKAMGLYGTRRRELTEGTQQNGKDTASRTGNRHGGAPEALDGRIARSRTLGEDATIGIGPSAGQAEGGGCGNGRNPITPDEYLDYVPGGFGGTFAIRTFRPMGADFVSQPRTQDHTTTRDSETKTQKWQTWITRFLRSRVPTTEQQQEGGQPSEKENGWEWIARQAWNRRMAHEKADSWLMWLPPAPERSPDPLTTIPVAPSRSPRVMILGKFTTAWNKSRRHRLIIAERQRVENNTQHANERCRDCKIPMWDAAWRYAPEGAPADWKPRSHLQPGICSCRMGCYHPMERGHLPFCMYCDPRHCPDGCCCPCAMCYPDTESGRPQDMPRRLDCSSHTSPSPSFSSPSPFTHRITSQPQVAPEVEDSQLQARHALALASSALIAKDARVLSPPHKLPQVLESFATSTAVVIRSTTSGEDVSKSLSRASCGFTSPFAHSASSILGDMWRFFLTTIWRFSYQDEETMEETPASNTWTPSDAWPPDYSSRSLAQDYQGDE